MRDLYNKVEAKRAEEKTLRDNNNEKYLQLVDKQRQYFKTVLDFQEECRKTELLQMKLSEVLAQMEPATPATPMSAMATPLGEAVFAQ